MTFTFDLSQLTTFVLLLSRISGVFITAPMVGSERVPARIRLMLGLLVAVAMGALVTKPPVFTNNLELALAIGGEVMLGLALGFGARLIFIVVQMAGELADGQAGFGFAGMVSPDTNERISVIGQLQMALTWLIFLAANGHHLVLEGMAASLAVVPLGHGPGTLAIPLTQAVAGMLVAALRLAAPVIGAVLVSDIALGLLTRAAPQMNLFAIGFPIKLMTALWVTMLSLPLLRGAEHSLVGVTDDVLRSILAAG
jgi:flagellar biosynthesis protein FliR